MADFRAALVGTFASVTISGSADPTGVTCTGPTADQICRAIRTGGPINVACGGRTWTVQDCGGLELSASGWCTCGANDVTRIEPNDLQWGAANTVSCSPPTQTLTVTCTYQAIDRGPRRGLTRRARRRREGAGASLPVGQQGERIGGVGGRVVVGV